MELLSRRIYCPYCGESIEILIDDSNTEADYYEDCSVCCRPVRIQLSTDLYGNCRLVVMREDD